MITVGRATFSSLNLPPRSIERNADGLPCGFCMLACTIFQERRRKRDRTGKEKEDISHDKADRERIDPTSLDMCAEAREKPRLRQGKVRDTYTHVRRIYAIYARKREIVSPISRGLPSTHMEIRSPCHSHVCGVHAIRHARVNRIRNFHLACIQPRDTRLAR